MKDGTYNVPKCYNTDIYLIDKITFIDETEKKEWKKEEERIREPPRLVKLIMIRFN